MQLFFALSLLSVLAVSTKAQLTGGESIISNDSPEAQEVQRLILQELEKDAATLPGSPKVEMTDVVTKSQVVAGTRYNVSWKAVYTSLDGKKNTKDCTSSLIDPPVANSKLDFIDQKEKVKCT